MLQTLRSSVNYRIRGAWFDCVVYTVKGEIPVMGETGTPTARLHYGEVRALLRYREADLAVVCNMVPVEANEACPLGERQCTRLTWAVPAPGDGDWSISVVPISRVRRLIHVAPDFGELSVRKGVKALPARYTASVEERRAMHYYENALFPWDYTARCLLLKQLLFATLIPASERGQAHLPLGVVGHRPLELAWRSGRGRGRSTASRVSDHPAAPPWLQTGASAPSPSISAASTPAR